jgi:hypothetical protein
MNYRVLRLGKPVVVVAALAALGWLVMLLWNSVVPALFTGVRLIDYWHAIGLLVLSRVLFGGFRGGGGWRQHRHWRRWEAMTPEEREHFKESFQARYKKQERP